MEETQGKRCDEKPNFEGNLYPKLEPITYISSTGGHAQTCHVDTDQETTESPEYVNMFVIGKTGTGKSSLCNKIVGKAVFPVGRTFKSITRETREEPVDRRGLHIKVVDTPDISINSLPRQKEIVDSWRKTARGHNYMVVLAVRCDERYTPAAYEVYRQIKQLWGHDLVKKLVVAFTFGDTREDPDLDMKKELEEVWSELKHVIKDANNRYVVFNKEDANKDEAPVSQLVEYFKLLQAAEQEQEQEQECSPPCSTKAIDICPEANNSQRMSRCFKIVIGATVCLIAGTFGYLVFAVSNQNNIIRALMSKMAW